MKKKVKHRFNACQIYGTKVPDSRITILIGNDWITKCSEHLLLCNIFSSILRKLCEKSKMIQNKQKEHNIPYMQSMLSCFVRHSIPTLNVTVSCNLLLTVNYVHLTLNFREEPLLQVEWSTLTVLSCVVDRYFLSNMPTTVKLLIMIRSYLLPNF